jgi:hypothetical protein
MSRKKALQMQLKPSTTPNQPQREVEVKANSLVTPCLQGLGV